MHRHRHRSRREDEQHHHYGGLQEDAHRHVDNESGHDGPRRQPQQPQQPQHQSNDGKNKRVWCHRCHWNINSLYDFHHHGQLQNQDQHRRRRFLITSATIALTFIVLPPIRILYNIFISETLPSPFLSSPRNFLSLKKSQRGVPPPSEIFRFPTPEQRVRFYMGHWADETSNATIIASMDDEDNICKKIKYWQYGMPEQGSPYRFTAKNLQQLIWDKCQYRFPWRPQRSHPGDAYLYHFQTVVMHNSGKRNKNNEKKQMVLQFGDGKDSANFLSTPFPIMVKTRLSQPVWEQRFGGSTSTGTVDSESSSSSSSKKQIDDSHHHPDHHPPIIGMYEIHRHYNDHFYETDELWDQIPWSSKLSKLVWRGSTSGKRKDFVVPYLDNRSNNGNGKHNTTELIDIGFSEILKIHRNKFPKPDSFYMKDELSIRQLLQHKYLLVLEGWGMASSLKWMLYSNSVVFMVPPTKVSWAMEDKLVPFVHYIPLYQNYSNLQQQLEWAIDHDDEVYKIVLQSRHYMESLVTSPQAHQETIEILNRMDDIYQQNFGSLLQNCPSRS